MHPVSGSQAVQICLDKGIQRAVHNRIDIGSFVAGAGILNQGIGHEHIVADLAAPLDLLLNALDVGDHSLWVSLLSLLTVVVTFIMEELKVWQTLPVKVA